MGDVTRSALQWHGRTVDEWRRRWGLPGLHILERVPSTNDFARSLAEDGCPEGTVVLADHQTHGRGRRGRAWVAGPGQGLALSMVLRPRRTHTGDALPLRVGLAAARAVEDVTGVRVGIKWPNDLVVRPDDQAFQPDHAGGQPDNAGVRPEDPAARPDDPVVRDRKLGGVLCEAVREGGQVAFVLAGVGINVHQGADDWPRELRGIATSLAEVATAPRMPEVAGAAPRMPDLAGAVARQILHAGAGGRLGPAELEELRERDVLRGRPITVDGREVGIAAGIDDDGALLVRTGGTPEGTAPGTGDGVRRIVSGTVRPLDSTANHTLP
ncbi:MAG TPA: biotin--[acetyl-CoA-carboxylase] ligase [Longimicrobiales bacterium]|nr:biotin--[acetyl-CoA-carboxylase] ligase [Longimicrobiales bacterium]